MGKVADSIRRGLEEAIAFAESDGTLPGYRVTVPTEIDVRAIRDRLGLTQSEFAHEFGFSINTLRHWEQKNRQPEGPTRAYLMVIDRSPNEVRKALHS